MPYQYQDIALAPDITEEKLAQTITDAIDFHAYSCEITKVDGTLTLRIWYRDGIVEKEKPDSISAKKLGSYIKKAIDEQDVESCEVRDLSDGGLRVVAWPTAPYDLATATKIH